MTNNDNATRLWPIGSNKAVCRRMRNKKDEVQIRKESGRIFIILQKTAIFAHLKAFITKEIHNNTMEKKFKRTTVTSALPYANGPVHIGHLAGVYVPADI